MPDKCELEVFPLRQDLLPLLPRDVQPVPLQVPLHPVHDLARALVAFLVKELLLHHAVEHLAPEAGGGLRLGEQ